MASGIMRYLTHRWLQVFILLFLLSEGVFIWVKDPPAIARIRQVTFDTYNRLMPRPPHNDAVIVDIDEDSLRIVGQWPWPRPLIGDLVLALKEMGAKAVVFDMAFAEPDRTSPAALAKWLLREKAMEEGVCHEKLMSLPDNDSVFADRIREAGNVVTGFCVSTKPTGMIPKRKVEVFNIGKNPDPLKFATRLPHVTATLPKLADAAEGDGSFSVQPDGDGVIRHVPLLVGVGANVMPALSLEAVRVAHGKSVYKVESYGEPGEKGYGIKSVTVGDYRIPTGEAGQVWVYYTGHREDLYVSAWKVLASKNDMTMHGDNALDPDVFRDKIVMVGTSATGLFDLRSSPLSSVLAGVEVHVELIEQILNGQYLHRSESFEGAEIITTVIVSLCIIFLAPFVGTGALAALVTMLLVGAGVGALYAYQYFGWLIAPVYPALIIVVIFIGSSVLSNLRSELDRKAVRTAFSHYISPALMNELASDPSRLKLGGEVREMSIMFTDIRNFTTIAEQMDPAELIQMMNDFLTPMTSCVLDNRGTVDKYMGDAMMAFWNAPLDDPDHARHACLAALRMLESLESVNTALQQQLGPRYRELRAGIGIHTGKCSVGSMGSRQRFAYSALGDTVNLASRLEGQTKAYGVSILISGATRKAVRDFATLEVDLLTVKGRTEPIHVYALLGGAEMASGEKFMAHVERHTRMIVAYRAKRWDEALTLGSACAEVMPSLSGLYDLYATRIATYKENPPPKDWDGAWVAQSK